MSTQPKKSPSAVSRRVVVQGAVAAALLGPACVGEVPNTDGGVGGGEGGGSGGGAGGGTGGGDAGANNAPVWATVPDIVFVQGVASTVSVASWVSDLDGDMISLMKNSVSLPAGVTFNATGKEFVYDGVGAIATSAGHVLTADDGR